jgi:hypothetical protein
MKAPCSPRREDAAVPYRELVDEPVLARWMVRFGAAIRASRLAAAVSQGGLERMSGVDQTTISRLEHGLTPSMPLVRLARLSIALRGWLPFGRCPHDHDCPWSRPMLEPWEYAVYAQHRHLIAAGLGDPRYLEMIERLTLETSGLVRPAPEDRDPPDA